VVVPEPLKAPTYVAGLTTTVEASSLGPISAWARSSQTSLLQAACSRKIHAHSTILG
jgi:hypothetical protein